MRFLAKDAHSLILAANMTYSEAGHNDDLRKGLLKEQNGFCAYTEMVITLLDTIAIEHFEPRKKGTYEDDYYNYYCVLQSANQRKRRKEAKHAGARFFESRFFQQPGAFALRIQYLAGDYVYEERGADDGEARDLVDYLGFNDHELFEERRKHILQLRDLFDIAGLEGDQQVAWFRRHPEHLHHITALEHELGLGLAEVMAVAR